MAQQQPAGDLRDGDATPAQCLHSIAILRAGRQAAEVELAEVAAERQALAPGLRVRDAAALARLPELNARAAGLTTELDTSVARQDMAGELLAVALERQERASVDTRKPHPVALARALVKQDARADALMRALHDSLFARAAL